VNYVQLLNTNQTPQTQPIPGSNQVQNAAGGFVWKLDRFAILDRFLILGCEKGTYYATAQTLTRDHAMNVLSLIADLRDQQGWSGSEERSGNLRLGDLRVAWKRRDPGGGVDSIANGLPDGNALVPVRGSLRWFAWLGSGTSKGDRKLVQRQAGRRVGVPGDQVQATGELVAPGPLEACAPVSGNVGPQVFVQVDRQRRAD